MAPSKSKIKKIGEISFFGGANSATGLCIGYQKENFRALIDCGMPQQENLPTLPSSLIPHEKDFLFVTHAHIDHIGLIPLLVREGFQGRIISTPPTKDIARFMLEDSFIIQKHKAEAREVLFSREDISRAFDLWESVPYDKTLSFDNVKVEFLNAGHILGSAMIRFFAEGKVLVITGDLGNTPAPLLDPPASIQGTNFLVMESVYGDRLHEDTQTRLSVLEDVVEDVVKKNGVLLIPVFSLERTQALLYDLIRLVEDRKVPSLPVFIDSPLAARVTTIYEKHRSYLKEGLVKTSRPLFDFPFVSFTRSLEDSRRIFSKQNPKIILAGSGMSHGGRVLEHEQHYLSDPRTTLLLVGYQAPGTLGRRLQDGSTRVEILGKQVLVRARVMHIDGYSAHMDRDQLLHFVAHAADTLEQVYLVSGEPRAQSFLAQRIRDYLGIRVFVPQSGQVVSL